MVSRFTLADTSYLLVVNKYLAGASELFAQAEDGANFDLSDLHLWAARFCVQAIAARGMGVDLDLLWGSAPDLKDLIPVASKLQIKFILDRCTERVDALLEEEFDPHLFRVAEKHLKPPMNGWSFIATAMGPRKKPKWNFQTTEVSKETILDILSRF